jgi:NitT/TauT family transport system substrate-binding protein
MFRKSLKQIVLATFGLASCVLLAALPAKAADSVNLALDWVVGGVHAGYYVAKDKGFYSSSGLDVTIQRGFGSGDTIKRVASGTATFGIADTSAVIAALANESIPVRIVGMVYDHATIGLIYLAQSGIKTPKDLIGRKIGRSASGASVNMFPAFLKANNIDRGKLHEVVVDGATFVPILMSGQVDAVLEQSILIGKFQRIAASAGKKAVAMPYSEFGLAGYGNGIIANLDTIKNKKDIVSRFVAATLKGTAYAFDHPQEAIAIMRKSHPELDAQSAEDQLLALKDIENTAQIRKAGLGHIEKVKMEKNRDNVVSALSLKKSVPVDQIYTDSFLPAQPIFPTGK